MTDMRTKIRKTPLVFVLSCLLTAASAFAGEVDFEEDFSLPIAYINLVTDAGSAQDPADKAGLAHIANQMFLRGTQTRDKIEFFKQLNKLGGTLEVEVRNEGTVIRGAVLSESIQPFLELVAEAISKPKFTDGELAKLKKEVEGEILERKGNDLALLQYNFPRFMYGSHPYGNPVTGNLKGVENITQADVNEFYAKNYGGETIHLFGSGAVKSGVVKKWFEGLADKLTSVHPEAKSPQEVATPDLEKGRRTLIVDKPNATQSQVQIGTRGMRPEMKGFYEVLLANHSFGGASFQARLMQEIRVKRGWSYGASSSFRFGRKPKHYGIYYFPKTDDTTPAIDLSLKMFDEFIKNGISDEEFKFAKSSLVNNAPFNYDTSKKRLENTTNEYLLHFPRGYFKDFAGNIDKVEYGDIRPALKKNFDDSNLALVIIGDAKRLKEPASKLHGFSAPTVKSYLED